MTETELFILEKAANLVVHELDLEGHKKDAKILRDYHTAAKARITELEAVEVQYSILKAHAHQFTAEYLDRSPGGSIRPFVAKLVECRGAGGGERVAPATDDGPFQGVEHLNDPPALGRAQFVEVGREVEGLVLRQADQGGERLEGGSFDGHETSESDSPPLD